ALVLGAADRLDDEDVRAADRLLVAAVDLAVRERLEARVDRLYAQLLGDLPAQLHAGAAGGEHEALFVGRRDAAVFHRFLRGLEEPAHFCESSWSLRSA